VLPERARTDLEEQIARRIHRHPIDAVERHDDSARVGAGRDEEVVFELAVAPVVLDIDALVDTGGPHAAERRDVGRPGAWIVAAVVVRLSRERLGPVHRTGRLAAEEAEADLAGRPAGLDQREPRAGRPERHLVALAASREADAPIELAVVALEGERQAGEQVAARSGCDGRDRGDALRMGRRGCGRRRRRRRRERAGVSVRQGNGEGACRSAQ
jgi:hypothetical protein